LARILLRRAFGGLRQEEGAAMRDSWIFIIGLVLLFVMVAAIGKRLSAEYRNHLAPSLQTVAAVWIFYALHLSLVVLAAVWSTWHINLPSPIAVGGGAAIIAIGIAIHLSASHAFGSLKRQSGFDTTRLVTGGIYRWSRNPLLVGWTLILAGIGLLGESAMALLLAVVFWISYRLYLPLEEELLTRLYGEAYEKYRRSTHRYFGPPNRSGAE
jgi:protein-S-isoprenylcysteine O-methyltransferase Ste14